MTKMALVPVELDEGMQNTLTALLDAQIVGDATTRDSYALFAVSAWRAMWRASPTSGRVSRADLERAAEAGWSRTVGNKLPWADASEQFKSKWRGDLCAALRALGLSLGPGIQDEGEV